MNYTDDFLKALELIDLPKVALSHDELARLAQRVSAQIAREQAQDVSSLEIAPETRGTMRVLKRSENTLQMRQLAQNSPKAESTKKKKLKVFPKALAGIAASLALVVCIGASVPAFAAEVPIVGDVFAWIYQNTTGWGHLRSEQLDEYAQDVTITAEPSQDSDGTVSDLLTQSDLNPNPDQTDTSVSAPVIASAYVGDNIDVTITQVYCDGLYLRMSAVVTAEDDSLAQFESLGIGYAEKVYAPTNHAGSAWIGGEEVYLQNGFSIFEKQDDTTFVGELAYRLETYVGFDVPYGIHAVSLAQDVSQPFTATIRFGGLLGYTGNYVYVESSGLREFETMLLAESDVSFDVSVTPDDSQIRGTTVQTADNGIAVEQIFASPCATQITLSIPEELYEATVHTEMLLSTIDGAPIYPHEGASSGDSDDFMFSMVFGAIPEDVSEVVVSLVNKNNSVTLVEFTCALSYEDGAPLTAASSSGAASSASAVATPSVTVPTFLTDPFATSEIDATETDANTVITQGIEYYIPKTSFEIETQIEPELAATLDDGLVSSDGTFNDGWGLIRLDCTFKNVTDTPKTFMVNMVSIAFQLSGKFTTGRFETRSYGGIDSSKELEMQQTLAAGEALSTTLYVYARHDPFFESVEQSSLKWFVLVNPSGTYPYNEFSRSVEIALPNLNELA